MNYTKKKERRQWKQFLLCYVVYFYSKRINENIQENRTKVSSFVLRLVFLKRDLNCVKLHVLGVEGILTFCGVKMRSLYSGLRSAGGCGLRASEGAFLAGSSRTLWVGE